MRNVNSLLKMVPTAVQKEKRRQSSPVKTCPYCGNKNKYVKMN